MKELLDLLKRLTPQIETYNDNKPEKCIFNAVSDMYYRENFHSDVIAYYLSYDIPKRCLINWINEQQNSSEEIVFAEYENSIPIREEGRRDITIYSQNHKRAIFIENKSNEAEDMDKQVYRYYRSLRQEKVEVDAIVYLNKKTIKEPSYTGWNNKEINTIKQKLLVTTLTGHNSFCEKVLDEVIKNSNDIRLSAFSMELKALFANIIKGDGIMNNSDLEEFMSVLSSGNNATSMKKLVQIYNDLPNSMREYYYNYIQSLRTDGLIPNIWHVGRYTRTCVFIDCMMLGEINYVIDIWFTTDSFEMVLHTRNTDINEKEACDHLKQLMGQKWIFPEPEQEDGFYTFSSDRVFDEKVVKRQITDLLQSIRDVLSGQPSEQ